MVTSAGKNKKPHTCDVFNWSDVKMFARYPEMGAESTERIVGRPLTRHQRLPQIAGKSERSKNPGSVFRELRECRRDKSKTDMRVPRVAIVVTIVEKVISGKGGSRMWLGSESKGKCPWSPNSIQCPLRTPASAASNTVGLNL
jgi:hypothetical protein